MHVIMSRDWDSHSDLAVIDNEIVDVVDNHHHVTVTINVSSVQAPTEGLSLALALLLLVQHTRNVARDALVCQPHGVGELRALGEHLQHNKE